MAKKRITTRVLLLVSGVLVVACLLLVFSNAPEFRQQLARNRTVAQLTALHGGASDYLKVFGRWPPTVQELSINASNIVFVSPITPWKDGWGRPILYTPPSGTNRPGSFLSLGRDGILGGTAHDTDIEIKLP